MELLIIWLVTAVSLLIISRIELFGIEIENFGTALIVAVVLGLLNAVLRPVLNFFSLPLLRFSGSQRHWSRDLNLRRGCLSALIGPVLLGLLNSIILAILPGS